MREKMIGSQICYEQIKEVLKKQKQVLVFVHSRAETVNLGETFIQFMRDDKPQERALFGDRPDRRSLQSEVSRSTNRNLQKLFESGLGMHNAGMLRKDRNLSEKLFKEGCIKVLISTSTLAWGVNLPAYCVIIKGTEYYDPAQGKMVDVGILDIQQIFGRAGRPQFDTEGQAMIITSYDKMQNYIRLLTNQTPIESTLLKGLDDAINAEVANGNITSIEEGIRWLKFSFLEQRLSKNPLQYGSKADEIASDPGHRELYHAFIRDCAIKLKKEGLLLYNPELVSATT